MFLPLLAKFEQLQSCFLELPYNARQIKHVEVRPSPVGSLWKHIDERQIQNGDLKFSHLKLLRLIFS
jgi:hypothetical protein